MEQRLPISIRSSNMPRNRVNSITSARGDKKNRKKGDKVTIAILSAKPGYRMKSYGPPSLLCVGSHCLLDIQIEAIRAVHKNYEIIVCCGFEADRVSRHIKTKYKNQNIRIVENQLFDETNCCETLRLCLNNVSSDSLLVCNGELVLYPELVKIHEEVPYILSHKRGKKKSTLEIGSVCDENGLVTNMSYGLTDLWSEIFYLHSRETIESLRRIVSTEAFKNKLIFEALNEFNKTKYNLHQVMTKDKAVKIDNIKTYHRVKDRYENIGTQLFVRNFN